ncbi:MAG: hypothetical protein LBD25_02000 [Coriobacteriales bacterium]|jgi:hypothetical protein|nr:hypothetical protein [Coriobacteriales bacterium]
MIIIKAYSRRSLRIEHNGQAARFFGELDSVSFTALADSMQWILPDGTTEFPTQEERLELMRTIAAHTVGTSNHISFIDMNMDELQLDVPVVPGRRAKRKSIWKRLFG